MDHGPRLALSPLWTHDHGAAWTHQSLGARLLRGLGGHRDSSEREREEVIGVLTNGATWWRGCRDGRAMMFNRGGRWCSDGEMVLGARRGDWSQGGCDGECGALDAFYRAVGQRKADGQGEGGGIDGTSMTPITRDENGEGGDGVRSFPEGEEARRLHGVVGG
jgi:hypothetical protein